MQQKSKTSAIRVAFDYLNPIASVACKSLEFTVALLVGFVRDGAQLSTQYVNSVKRNRPRTQTLPKLKSSLCMIALGLGVSGVFNNAWAVCSGDTVISTDQTATQQNLSPTWLCSFTVNGDVSITGGSSEGIANYGTITTLNNSGTISGDYGIFNNGTITTLNNSSMISGQNGIYNLTTIATLNNSSMISGSFGIVNDVMGLITALNNSGTISSTTSGAGIANFGTIIELNNSFRILGDFEGIRNYGPISTLNNSDTISGRYGMYNGNLITTLNNSGTISGTSEVGIYNDGGTITTLNNSGTISGNPTGFYGGAGIYNDGTITTLNNAQGGNGSSASTTALTYRGTLPNSYNIIIRSPTEYGQLAVNSPSGSTTFGIFAGSTVRSGTYAAVLTGVTSARLVNTSGTYGTGTWELINSSGTIWDLFLAGFFSGPTTADTQQSLVNSAAVLQSTYALQNAVLANSFSYDCSVFGANNVCVSAGGRNTAVSAANGLNNTSALLIAAYRIKPTLRIGAYADQNLSVNNAGSTVNLGNNTPLIGLFGVWNERLDGTGTEVKVSAAYGQKNTTVNRQVVGTSEAGSGSSNLNSQGAQITAKYGFAVAPEVLVSPYVGVRYTQNNMGGYTEGASSTVTAPLTYSALNTNATTVLAGVGASYRFIPKATAFASAGVETDTNTSNGTYSATGVTGLTPVNFNPNPVKTRPTATLGAYYDIVKDQRIGITGIYRQESYQAISTTTVMATYTIGL